MDPEHSPANDPWPQDTPQASPVETPCRRSGGLDPRGHEWIAFLPLVIAMVPFLVGLVMIGNSFSTPQTKDDAVGDGIVLAVRCYLGFPVLLVSEFMALLCAFASERRPTLPRLALLANGLATLSMVAGALLCWLR